MAYAFSLDASACSGCKACQEACKDKNNLPPGLLWRRVVEVSGGGWQPIGNAWLSSVFAYNLTLACNHCTHPKCAGVCPTDAYTVRPDGIVLLNTDKCMGCGYCAWACPYGAPQYDQARGVMTKCDFCYDYLDEGLPPSCVAACPLRVLDFEELQALERRPGSRNLWQLAGSEHPYPLPTFSRTEPHLSITLHPGMNTQLAKSVSNREEVLPPGSLDARPRMPATRELPLVAFTLLTQMAVGMSVTGLAFSRLPVGAMLTMGLLLVAGGLISFLHLGNKRNAWRAVIHLRKSWLSREVVLTGLFGAAWAVIAGEELLGHHYITPWPMAVLGLALVYGMSRVYLLRAVPGWNTWRTPVAFLLSTLALGLVALRLFFPIMGWAYGVAVALVLGLELVLAITSRPTTGRPAGVLRAVLLGAGILGAVLIAASPAAGWGWLAPVVFSLVLAEEGLGRWLFYGMRTPFPMQK